MIYLGDRFDDDKYIDQERASDIRLSCPFREDCLNNNLDYKCLSCGDRYQNYLGGG